MGLGKLIFIYDDNQISIDGGTDLAFTEDVCKRFESYGFHCQHVTDGDGDLEGISNAIQNARNVTDRPSLIRVRYWLIFKKEKSLMCTINFIEQLLALHPKTKEQRRFMVHLWVRKT